MYTALDEEFSRPILDQFERRTGVAVRAVYDVESTKTVGLVNRILAEQARPRCDVFWNNEVLHTERLRRLELLAPYRSPAGDRRPAQFRAADGAWHGFAARARVLLVNAQLVDAGREPRSIGALADPAWRQRAGLAKPLFGATATHAAVLWSRWGPERAAAFFRQAARNARVLAGNRQVALAVGRGELAFGVTDTDDANLERLNGSPVRIVFPDQGPGEPGALLIPNTVAILRGAPHPDAARRLVDFLLSPDVERRLAAGPSAQIPLDPQVADRPALLGKASIRWMDVDFGAAAEAWDEAAAALRELFLGP